MGIVDAISAEDRVSVKISDFYRLMKKTAEAEAKEETIKKLAGAFDNDAVSMAIIRELLCIEEKCSIEEE